MEIDIKRIIVGSIVGAIVGAFVWWLQKKNNRLDKSAVKESEDKSP